MHLFAVKKFDKCGWSVEVFILLVKIFNCTFNLFINNVDKEPIIYGSLFYVFLILYEILFWRKRLILNVILGY